MATEQTFNGNNTNKNFTVSLFPFLRESHIKVQVGGQTKTLTTDYTVNGSIVQFITAPPTGTNNVRVYRDTPFTPLHDYSAGSTIKADALNENHLQLLYAVEEAKLVTVTAGGITTGSKNDITVNSNSDWVVNANAIETAMIANDQINADKIDDDVINSEHYVAGSIDTEHIADNQITLAKMAGGTDGNLITYDTNGDPAYVATGNATEVLTSNGAGAAPTFQTVVNVPVGTVIWYGGSTAPTGYLKCNGDAIANGSGTTQSITANFSALYAVVGANLPDLRGEFIRGFDDGKGTDSGRAIRSTQAEAYKSHAHDTAHDVDDPGHSHNLTVHSSDADSNNMVNMSDGGTSATSTQIASNTTGIDIDIAVEAEGGTETRPRNVALLACIKY